MSRVETKCAGVPPRQVPLRIGPHGRPELDGASGSPPVRFSLTHTRGLIACVLARTTDVGVDAEDLGRGLDLDAIARRYFAPAEVDQLREEGEKLIRAIAALPDLAKFKDQIQITITSEGLRIELIEQSEGLFFDIGSSRLKTDSVKLLRLIASRIGAFPNDVVIEGHTDSRPYVRPGYNNWDLSSDRANAARRVLEEGGVRDHQITGVNGYADRRLKTPEKPHDFSNRRVTILVAFSTSLLSNPQNIAPAALPLIHKPLLGKS